MREKDDEGPKVVTGHLITFSFPDAEVLDIYEGLITKTPFSTGTL